MDPLAESLVALTCELINRPSVTPRDEGCQVLLGERLRAHGFALEWLDFGDVRNLWATHGNGPPCLVFAGHTDVVPAGNREAWDSDPFEARVEAGMIYGRGSADMKGSLASMLLAAETFVERHPGHPGTVAFLLTSDEEGPAVDGTARVVAELAARGLRPEYCVVGEPSSSARAGDVIRIGRRGSLNARLTVRGVQGHVAYPETVDNPIHRALPALARLASLEWDAGNDEFPPTSLQITNLHAGTGATNVVPGTLEAMFNVRYSTEQTSASLIERIERLFREAHVDHRLEWTLSGEPFLTRGGRLLDAVTASIERFQGRPPERSTGGGTSDGRFIAPLGTEVVELGPVNATIHQVNEHVAIHDLRVLADVHVDLLERLLLGTA